MADRRTIQEIAVDKALMEARSHFFHALDEMPQASGSIVVSVEASIFNGQVSDIGVSRASLGKKLPMLLRHD